MLSVVIPAFNEQEMVPAAAGQIDGILSRAGIPIKYRYSKTPASITNAVASTISSAIFRDFFTLISLLE